MQRMEFIQNKFDDRLRKVESYIDREKGFWKANRVWIGFTALLVVNMITLLKVVLKN